MYVVRCVFQCFFFANEIFVAPFVRIVGGTIILSRRIIVSFRIVPYAFVARPSTATFA